MRVFVIDDDPIVLEAATATLEDLGHSVTALESAIGASSHLLREKPDVVLLDLMMPGLSGTEWLQLVSERQLARQTAFVIFSGVEVEELERMVRETRAIGYISKRDGPEGFQAAFEKIVQDLTG